MRHLNFKGVSILGGETEDDNANVYVSLPLCFPFKGGRPLSEYQNHIKESLDMDISTIFELIEFIGEAMRQDEIKSEVAAEFLLILGRIGAAFQPMLDDMNMAFERFAKETPKEKLLDISDQPECLDISKTVIAKISDPATAGEKQKQIKQMLDEMVSGGLKDYPPAVVEAFLCAPENESWHKHFQEITGGNK